jgi:hypothetical protein
MISYATQRWFFRWIHLVFSIPIVGWEYAPVGSEIQSLRGKNPRRELRP